MSEEVFETPQPATESKSTNWPKIILVAVLGFGLLAASAYAGYWYGTQQVQRSEEPTPVVSQPQPEADRPLDETPEPTTPPERQDAPQGFTRETIQVKVRNPFYPEETKDYLYKFTFDKKPGDTVELTQAPYQDQDFSSGIGITRDAVKMTVQPVFEGVSVTYNEIPEFEVITNWAIADRVIYRIRTEVPENNYVYVSDYGEGEQGCSQWSPLPVACSMGNLYMKDGKGLVVSCQAVSSGVVACDSIVRSLDIEITEL